MTALLPVQGGRRAATDGRSPRHSGAPPVNRYAVAPTARHVVNRRTPGGATTVTVTEGGGPRQSSLTSIVRLTAFKLK